MGRIMRHLLCHWLAILPLILLGTHADAAPSPPAQCGLTGFVDTGAGGMGGTVAGFIGPDINLSGSFLGFGESAVGYGCDNWMAQLDGAYYYNSFTNNHSIIGTLNGQDSRGHIGGALFLRDGSLGRVGLAASQIMNNTHLDFAGLASADFGGSLNRVGAFGDFYASDAITLGAGAFYVTGNPIDLGGPSSPETGFEGNIHAKFYATDNISLGMQGDLLSSNLNVAGTLFSWNGLAGTAEAEYLVPNSALSLLIGGRVASRTLYMSCGCVFSLNDTQAYLSVKWAFGGPVASLRARDRTGAYDNTSVFDEKLPGFNSDFYNAAFH